MARQEPCAVPGLWHTGPRAIPVPASVSGRLAGRRACCCSDRASNGRGSIPPGIPNMLYVAAVVPHVMLLPELPVLALAPPCLPLLLLRGGYSYKPRGRGKEGRKGLLLGGRFHKPRGWGKEGREGLLLGGCSHKPRGQSDKAKREVSCGASRYLESSHMGLQC